MNAQSSRQLGRIVMVLLAFLWSPAETTAAADTTWVWSATFSNAQPSSAVTEVVPKSHFTDFFYGEAVVTPFSLDFSSPSGVLTSNGPVVETDLGKTFFLGRLA